jgi:hypothetical protein
MTIRSAMGTIAHAAMPAAILLLSTTAAAQTKDNAPVALPAASAMTQDKRGSESWTYVNPAANFTKYRTVIVEPATVYTGPDAQFDDVDQADRTRYAAMMSDALRNELATSFPAPARPGADTLRVRMSLLGVDKTKGGVATATRVTPLGFGLSAAKSLLGKGGTFTGSVLYAVEAYDGQSGNLLFTAVRRLGPDPLDIPATLSTTDTVKAVARDFAQRALKKLQNMTGVAPAP